MAQATGEARLQKADNVRMVQSRDASYKPFFRMQLTAPEGIPKPKDPRSSIEILEGDHKYRPFYVQLGEETLDSAGRQSNVSRFVLLVIDVSGSMLESLPTGQSKFEAAKAAARQFGFQEGIDNVAVVPFESRQVVSGIRQAVFASSPVAVQAQIDSLPTPDRKGNTGLYTAVRTALEVLDQRKREDISRSVMLLVLTDGKNDVHPDRGDDPGLSEGANGLADVVEASRSSGLSIWTVGFGESIDTDALEKIASPGQYRPASNLQSLQQIFVEARKALINELGLTFATESEDSRSLTGRTMFFKVRMQADDGRLIESDPIEFKTPQSAAPPFEGLLTVDEERDWIDRLRVPGQLQSPPSGWLPILHSRLLIMAGLGIALAVFWFGLPRMIWPESYLTSMAASYVRAPSMPSRPQVPGGIPNVPRPNIPGPGRPAARPAAPPRSNPGATMTESKVTIGPRPGGGRVPPVTNPRVPSAPRRPADETIITGGQPSGETDPWGFDSPDAPPRR